MVSFTSGYGHRSFVRPFHNLLGLGIEKKLGSFCILDIVSVSSF